MSDEEASYGLVMPFTVCQSDGGPYDDAAFVAGYRSGTINAHLERIAPDELRIYVEPALLPQLDLIAMRHGYTMVSEPWADHPDEWALATFKAGRP